MSNMTPSMDYFFRTCFVVRHNIEIIETHCVINPAPPSFAFDPVCMYIRLNPLYISSLLLFTPGYDETNLLRRRTLTVSGTNYPSSLIPGVASCFNYKRLTQQSCDDKDVCCVFTTSSHLRFFKAIRIQPYPPSDLPSALSAVR